MPISGGNIIAIRAPSRLLDYFELIILQEDWLWEDGCVWNFFPSQIQSIFTIKIVSFLFDSQHFQGYISIYHRVLLGYIIWKFIYFGSIQKRNRIILTIIFGVGRIFHHLKKKCKLKELKVLSRIWIFFPNFSTKKKKKKIFPSDFGEKKNSSTEIQTESTIEIWDRFFFCSNYQFSQSLLYWNLF